jgi:membrane-associated phospholipid phosphatase
MFCYASRMTSVDKHSKRYLLSIATVILLVLNVYAVKVLVIFGSPLLFFTALLAEIVLLIILAFSVLRLLSTPESILRSLTFSVLKGLADNHYIKGLITSNTKLALWSKKRLKRDSPYGLPLTIVLLISVYFFVNFGGVMFNVITKGSLTHVDLRILNLMPSVRTPIQTSFFRVITTLANTETAILLMLLTAWLFWRKRQKVLAIFVIIVSAGEEAVSFVFKLIAHRMRPELALRLIHENSYSFPSGHTVRATVLFGLLAYLSYKSYASTRARILTAITYILAVFLVAVSRIYLGVHYPSDVWGSVLLGSSLLTIVIGLLEISSRYSVISKKKLAIVNRSIIAVPVLLVLFSIITAPLLVRIQPISTTPAFITVQTVDAETIQKLPIYSETLTGVHMEPINFIYVGYEDQIKNIFESNGWYRADPSTVANTLMAVAVGFQGRQYLTAPVTPSYLNFKPENIAFEQSTETRSLKQRHHTRLWRTDYALPDGRPIWVATASFDEGIEFAGPAKLPTHRINPNIDAERTYITTSLGLSNNLVDVVLPQLGKNASGDEFFTDGKAELINL